jgi:large subunit ribosomal protein L25
MAKRFELAAEPRADVGKGASRRLRREGVKVPGILYGGGDAPQAIVVDAHTLSRATEDDAFFSHILTLTMPDKASQVIARDMQLHPATGKTLHIDFQRIVEGQELTIDVPLHFLNEAECVGVKTNGGLIAHNMVEVEITCLPKDLPESIEVDVIQLDLGGAIHLSELKLPPGVVITAFRGLSDEEKQEHDSVVVSCHTSTIEQEVEALAAAETTTVSPEVATVKEEEAKEAGEEEKEED